MISRVIKKCFALIISTFLLLGCSTNSQQTSSHKGIINIPSTINLKINSKDVTIPLTHYDLLKHNNDGSTSMTTKDPANKTFKTPAYSTYLPNSKVIIDKNIKNQPKIKVSYFDKQSNKEVQLKLKDSGFNLPKTSGKYDYSIHSIWSNCDATYTFLVNIE
jgi:hypothetical protein